MIKIMSIWPYKFCAISVVILILVLGCTQFTGAPNKTAPMILESAEETLGHFRSVKELQVIDRLLPNAKGILILPSVIKGGLIGAAEAGTGVLLAKTPNGWSYPAYYMITAGSIGLQAGIQETEVVMIIRNLGALDALVKNQIKFGADMGITVGWQGIGYEGSTTTNIGADIIALVGPGMGAYGGLSLEGAALIRRRDLNESLYGPGVTPREILFEGLHVNPLADSLRSSIQLP